MSTWNRWDGEDDLLVISAYSPRDSRNIYDPVASIAASMRYVLSRYNVAKNGSNLARKVQQADPTRPPKGY